MQSKIGGHVTTGSRDGWGLVAPHLRGSVSFLADAFKEMSPKALRVWRHPGYTYAGQTVLDIMPGFDQLKIEDMPGQAAHYWPIIRDQAIAEEARLQVGIDYIKMTNEVGGGDDAHSLQKLVAFERALLPLAEADGWRLAIANCATDSPQWPYWESIIAPFVIEAARRGHIYSRHAYADKVDGVDHLMIVQPDGELTPAGPNSRRPFDELEWFRAQGYTIPMILGETGFYHYPGEKKLVDELGLYDVYAQRYPELGVLNIFTWGNWGDANVERASAALSGYLQERPFTEWIPAFEEDSEPLPGKHKAIVVKLPQDTNVTAWLKACKVAFDFRHTVTASHDDMVTLLEGGNAESFVKFSDPSTDAETVELVESLGYGWEPLYKPDPPPVVDRLDMAAYFVPRDPPWGPVYILSNNWGEGGERTQLQYENGYSYVVKNSQYEKRRIDTDGIYLVLDTSRGNNQYYTVSGGAWLPRFWGLGERFTRTEHVKVHDKSTCELYAEYDSTSEMRLKSHYDRLTINGLSFDDCVVFEWIVNGSVDETHTYAAGVGLIRWQKYDGRTSEISELTSGQEHNSREAGCFSSG